MAASHRRLRSIIRGTVISVAVSLVFTAPAWAALPPPADPYANGNTITLSATTDPAQGLYDFTGNIVFGGGNGITPPLTSTDLTRRRDGQEPPQHLRRQRLG